MTILVTGGTGYIGSHTVVELLNSPQWQSQEIVIVDNLSNSNPKVLSRIEAICGKMPTFIKADICDADALREVFKNHDIDAVIHFAGFKAVGESNEF
ncbi:MAG: UDP-glucose 4-epimerase, partial [Phenylobacterium sp.]